MGSIFGSPDQAYKTNADLVSDVNDLSQMSNVKMIAIKPDQENNLNMNTNQSNDAEGDDLNPVNLRSNRIIQLKPAKRDLWAQLIPWTYAGLQPKLNYYEVLFT